MSLATFANNAGYAFGENRLTLVAVVILGLLLLCAIFGHALAPYDPLATDATAKLVPPSLAHLFGTDALGRDILSRVMAAARLDLGMAISAGALSFSAGLALGAVAGYFGGWPDRIIGRAMDTIMAFPLFVLAMGIVAALGNSVLNIIIATMVINLPFYCRFARAEVNVRREVGYVEAARMGGNRPLSVLIKHIVPNILPPMMVQASLNMGWAILNAAGLSFIGLGVQQPTPEWGIMVSEGAADRCVPRQNFFGNGPANDTGVIITCPALPRSRRYDLALGATDHDAGLANFCVQDSDWSREFDYRRAPLPDAASDNRRLPAAWLDPARGVLRSRRRAVGRGRPARRAHRAGGVPGPAGRLQPSRRSARGRPVRGRPAPGGV